MPNLIAAELEQLISSLHDITSFNVPDKIWRSSEYFLNIVIEQKTKWTSAVNMNDDHIGQYK